MIQRLSSISITFYSLIVLILLMGTGVFLTMDNKAVFAQMNEVHIFEWLVSAWETAPLVVVWFIVLCVCAGILLVNALCCTLGRQFSLARKSSLLKNWLFFILHCLFIMVLICHGLILVVGEKESLVPMLPGQVHHFGSYEIGVSEVVFSDDMKILYAPKKKQRALMTRNNINIHENYVFVTLIKNGRILASKKVMMLSPLKYNSLQVTLVDFTAGPDKPLGVNLTLTMNFLNRFFFVVYGVMILALMGFVGITWKKTQEQIK